MLAPLPKCIIQGLLVVAAGETQVQAVVLQLLKELKKWEAR